LTTALLSSAHAVAAQPAEPAAQPASGPGAVQALGAAPAQPVGAPASGSPSGSAGTLPVPSLQEVLKRAEKKAPQVRLGTAALDVSRSGFVNAKRPPLGNPYFELVGQHGNNGATNGISYIGTFWLPIELVGQRGKRIAEAEAYVSLHQKTLDQAEASALGEAVNAYGVVVVAAERLRVLEEVVRNSKTTADLYEARLQAGDAILRDATIARVEHAKNQVLLQDAHGRMAVAFTDLSRLTGERYDSVSAPSLHPPDFAMDGYLAKGEKELAPAIAAAEAEAQYYGSQSDRLQRESWGNFQLMLVGGRGDQGEVRLGAGVAYELPAFRANQGEIARADAERLRAQTERSIRQSYIDTRISGVVQQYKQLQKAHEVLSQVALPAANEAVEAAQATLQAGKDDWFIVLMTRRDQAMLKLQSLDLIERQWWLLGELVHLTGDLP